ncbi:MAG: hypothetical protein GX640_14720 [Fibrobacter sp.]|nr:hypothetical protein [Fibrobacter sp.]
MISSIIIHQDALQSEFTILYGIMFAITDDMKKEWNQLTSLQRRLIISGAVVELLLLIGAQADIIMRPSKKINGPKIKWILISLIDFFGPVSYFIWGRKK